MNGKKKARRAPDNWVEAYWVFEVGPGHWCILGNQGTARTSVWWVADGAYSSEQSALRVLNGVIHDGNIYHRRDWFGIGEWEMPTGAGVDEAIEEATRRLSRRWAAERPKE